MTYSSRFWTAARSKACGALLAATSLSIAAPAHAEASKTHIAVDLDFNVAVDELDVDAGAGGALRLGQEFDLFLVSLTPELGGSYHSFGGDDKTKVYAGFLGGRLAVGKVVEPSLFGHVGLGRLDGVVTRTAPIFDVGLALDFTLLPLINFGLHGAYNVVAAGDDGGAFKFVTLGAQAALVF